MKIQKFIFYSFFLPLILAGADGFSQDRTYAEKIVRVLSSRKMEGRGYFKMGETKAANYVRSEMKKIGLSPLNGKYEQPFTIPVNVFDGNISFSYVGNELEPGTDFIVSPGSPQLKGIFKTSCIDVRTIGNDKDIYDRYFRQTDKAIVLDYGTLQSLSDTIKENWQQMIEVYKKDTTTGMPVFILKNYPRMMWSVATSVDAHPVVYISEDIEFPDPEEVIIQIDQTFVPQYKTRNIFGIVPGSVKSDTFLVITAHYDHLGRMGEDTFFPGANDNASGVALMLDLARFFMTNRSSLKYSMLFVAFGAEEAGLLGSIHFVHEPPVNLECIRFLLNLDLAGTGDEGITIVNATIFKEEYQKLININEREHFLPQIKSRGEACNSDHCPFYLSGVPCFYIYTLGGIQAYHDVYDRYETLPLTNYEGYFRLLTTYIQSINYQIN